MAYFHKWYKGKREQIGDYIFRDDECFCKCVRRTVLNDENKEEIEHYSIGDDVVLTEPECPGSSYQRRAIYNRAVDGDFSIDNPKIIKRIERYISKEIATCSWINNKSFTTSPEVASEVYAFFKENQGKEFTAIALQKK